MARLPFLIAYSLPLIHLLALEQRGPWVFLALLNVFGMIPVLDALSGKSTREADLDAPRLSFHDRVLEFWVPTQLGLLAWTIYSLSTRPATQAELIGITISMGLLSGAVGINIAHELMHRKERAHRALAEIL